MNLPAKIKIPIFQAGCHRTLPTGQACLTGQDLAKSARAYSPSRFQAPLVIGDPKNDDPAAGWVDALASEGPMLYAVIGRISSELKAWLVNAHKPRVAAAFFAPRDPGNPSPGVYYLRDIRLREGINPTPSCPADPSFAIPLGHTPPFKVPKGYTIDPVQLEAYRAFIEEQRWMVAFQ